MLHRPASKSGHLFSGLLSSWSYANGLVNYSDFRDSDRLQLHKILGVHNFAMLSPKLSEGKARTGHSQKTRPSTDARACASENSAVRNGKVFPGQGANSSEAGWIY